MGVVGNVQQSLFNTRAYADWTERQIKRDRERQKQTYKEIESDIQTERQEKGERQRDRDRETVRQRETMKNVSGCCWQCSAKFL